MKPWITTVGMVALCARLSAHAQGTFQNLGFEAATIVSASNPSYVQFAPAFPGWTASVAGIQQTNAVHNNEYLDSSIVSILDSNSATNMFLVGNTRVIDGSYTAVLQAGYYDTNSAADTQISQTGFVPASSQSLLFKAALYLGGFSGSFAVTLGGQNLPLTPLLVATNYTLFGADIHQLAGQTRELTFTVFAERPHIGNTYLYLDSIQFSNQSIPEPGTFSLAALGALALHRRFRRSTAMKRRR